MGADGVGCRNGGYADSFRDVAILEDDMPPTDIVEMLGQIRFYNHIWKNRAYAN
jgi:hypothetical protein